jgi:hypothetical protein
MSSIGGLGGAVSAVVLVPVACDLLDLPVAVSELPRLALHRRQRSRAGRPRMVMRLDQQPSLFLPLSGRSLPGGVR